MQKNPFAVKSPDQLTPEDVALFFVDTYTDFAKVAAPENTFIHGARGTGKSMMLRGLDAPVQLKLRSEARLHDLPHTGIHVPIKARQFRVPELTMAGGSANAALGEHLLTMVVAAHVAMTLESLASSIEPTEARVIASALETYYHECGGAASRPAVPHGAPSQSHFGRIRELCDAEVRLFNRFTALLPMNPDASTTYRGAICTFADFLLPIFDVVRDSPSFSKAPVFLMLDDADNLPLPVQRVINTWISMRTTTRCCLKVTTQLAYGTYRTLDWRLIESPHDFNEVDITSVYTQSTDAFYRRVEEIVKKRLEQAQIGVSPADFFPVDEAQASRLEQIRDRLRAEWEARNASKNSSPSAAGVRKGGTRASDDVTRYAVPELMRELAGGKSSHTFSYAGFASLVNLSSGVIRWFLEPAAEMYGDVAKNIGSKSVDKIPVDVQDRVIRRWSGKLLDEVTRLGEDPPGSAVSEDASLHARVAPEVCLRLRTLLLSLGEFFRRKILDQDSSERRAFSIVLRGDVGPELKAVLELGLRQGYFQRADNAAKEGAGRRLPRYILARRLGPRFDLDVSGYAAHLSMTTDDLTVALYDKDEFLKRRAGSAEHGHEQLSLISGATKADR